MRNFTAIGPERKLLNDTKHIALAIPAAYATITLLVLILQPRLGRIYLPHK